MRGAEVVVHLAATSDETPFVESLVPHNIIGTYNVLQAALDCGVQRVIFASSCAAVGARRDWQEVPDERVETDQPPRPHKLYGVSKVCGEVLRRYFFDKHALEFIAIRIGAFGPYKAPEKAREGYGDLWLSPRDCTSLFRRAIEKPGVGYAIVNGTSRTIFEHLSLASAREILGWEPQDDGHPLPENEN